MLCLLPHASLVHCWIIFTWLCSTRKRAKCKEIYAVYSRTSSPNEIIGSFLCSSLLTVYPGCAGDLLFQPLVEMGWADSPAEPAPEDSLELVRYPLVSWPSESQLTPISAAVCVWWNGQELFSAVWNVQNKWMEQMKTCSSYTFMIQPVFLLSFQYLDLFFPNYSLRGKEMQRYIRLLAFEGIFPKCWGEQVANAKSFTSIRSNCVFLRHLVRSRHQLSAFLNEMSQMFKASEIAST